MRLTEFFVLGSAVAAFSLGAVDGASSGDLGRPVYAPSLPVHVSPPYVWTTCYGGLNAGGVWSPGIGTFGFTGGGQLGCNWQWDRVVLGGEADLQYTGLDGSRDVFAPSAGAHEDFRTRWLATFRGRIGWLVVPNMNFYATGGLALANVNTASSVNFNGTINNVSDSTTHAGWTLGAGLEWKFAERWSAKVEYLYVDLGHATDPLPISNNDLSLTENIFRIGINYHFYPW